MQNKYCDIHGYKGHNNNECGAQRNSKRTQFTRVNRNNNINKLNNYNQQRNHNQFNPQMNPFLNQIYPSHNQMYPTRNQMYPSHNQMNPSRTQMYSQYNEMSSNVGNYNCMVHGVCGHPNDKCTLQNDRLKQGFCRLHGKNAGHR